MDRVHEKMKYHSSNKVVRNGFWAVLWVLDLVASLGYGLILKTGNLESSDSRNLYSAIKLWITILVVVFLVVGVVMNVLHLAIAVKYPRFYITSGLWIPFGLCVAVFLAALSMCDGDTRGEVGVGGVIVLALAALAIAFISTEKEYSIKLLQKSTGILMKNYQIWLFEIGYCVVSLIATAFYGSVMMALTDRSSDDHTPVTRFCFLLFSYFWILSGLRYAIYMLESSITTSSLKNGSCNISENIADCFGPMFGVAAMAGFVVSLLKVLYVIVFAAAHAGKDDEKDEKKRRRREKDREQAQKMLAKLTEWIECVSRGAIMYCGIHRLSFFGGVKKWLTEGIGARYKKFMHDQILTTTMWTYHWMFMVLAITICILSTGLLVNEKECDADEIRVGVVIFCSLAMHFIFSVASTPIRIITETIIVRDAEKI